MTIGLGFVCSDGIVIGADRQVTNLSAYTFQEDKITSIAWKNGKAIWGYAGNYDTARKLRAELIKRFSGLSVSRMDLKEYLEDILETCLGKKERFYMLFGAQTEGEQNVLFVTNGTDALEVEKCEIIGGGDSSLSRYLRGVYLGVPFPPQISQAVLWATYFIQQAKRYDGEYCGGATNISTLDFFGTLNIVEVHRIEELEKQMQFVEYASGVLFAFLTTKGIPDDRIEEELETYKELVRNFCAKVRK
jgi:hypothetical protein